MSFRVLIYPIWAAIPIFVVLYEGGAGYFNMAYQIYFFCLCHWYGRVYKNSFQSVNDKMLFQHFFCVHSIDNNNTPNTSKVSYDIHKSQGLTVMQFVWCSWFGGAAVKSLKYLRYYTSVHSVSVCLINTLMNVVPSVSRCHQMTHISLEKWTIVVAAHPHKCKNLIFRNVLFIVRYTSCSSPEPVSRRTDRNNSFQAHKACQCARTQKIQSSLKSVNSLVFLAPWVQDLSRECV